MGILDTLHDGAFTNDDPLRDAYLKMKSDETKEKVEDPEVESDTKKQVITEKTVNAKIEMDPVGKEDGDVDNDGDKDSSDKYLLKRRKAIQKSIAKNKKKAPAETKLNGGKDDIQINPKLKEMSADLAYRAMDKADKKSRGEMSVMDPKRARKKARQSRKFADYSIKKTLNKEKFDVVHEYALEENMKRDIMGFGAKLQAYADKKGGIDKDYFGKIAKTAMSGRMPDAKDVEGDTDPRDFVLKMMSQTFPKKIMKAYVGLSPSFDQYMKEAYDVKTAKTKYGKITVKSFDSHDDAKAHLASMNKKGHKGIISQGGKPVKEENIDEVESDYAKEIEAFKAQGGKIKKLPPGKKFKSKFSKVKGPKKLPIQEGQAPGVDAHNKVAKQISKDRAVKKKRDHDYEMKWGKKKDTKSVHDKHNEEVEIDEAKKPNLTAGMECQECGKKFRAKLKTLEYGKTKCPKCKSTDLDFAYGAKNESIELINEVRKSDYQLYHKDFSSAMQHAYEVAKKRGYTVDPEEIDSKVATGPRKPSSGKTNRYILGTDKKQNLHVQVANLDNKRYELNMYIESVQEEDMKSIKDLKEVESAYAKQIADYKAGGGTVKKYTGPDMKKVKSATAGFKKKLAKTNKLVAQELEKVKAEKEANKQQDEAWKKGTYHVKNEEVSKNVRKLNKVLENRKRELKEGNITNQNNTMFRRFESMVEYLLGVSVENPDQFQVFPVGDNYRLEYEHGPVTTLGENDIINFMGPNVDKEMFIDLLKEFGVAITTEENSFVRGERDQVYKEVETPYGEKVSTDPPSTVPEEVSQDYADRYQMDNIVELIKKNANSIGGLGGPKYV